MPIPIEFSIVVAGSDCNPTVLNPDFLQRRNIVPEQLGWGLSQPPFTTPPAAGVSYDSGVVVQVETNKVQIKHMSADLDIASSEVPAITRRYIKELPHVRYTAVGINFRYFTRLEDPEEYLRGGFLRDGPWKDDLQALSLTLAYPLVDGRLHLSLNGGTAVIVAGNKTEEQHGILTSANFHRDFEEYPSDQRVIELIGKWDQDLSSFNEQIESFFDTETVQQR